MKENEKISAKIDSKSFRKVWYPNVDYITDNVKVDVRDKAGSTITMRFVDGIRGQLLSKTTLRLW